VFEPSILLLDEPFAHLDYKVKQRLLAELKRIQKETGTTVVYVTHDQGEAMMISHKIAIMREGSIEQVGTPEEIYDNPASLFVATFFGEANIIPGSNGRTIIVRPEKLVLNPGSGVDRILTGTVVDVVFQGAFYKVEVKVNGHTIKLFSPRTGKPPSTGERVRVGWRKSDEKVVRR
jgi:ABC-type Fe3+/spermidine/putrescine transport system ATPase subunit